MGLVKGRMGETLGMKQNPFVRALLVSWVVAGLIAAPVATLAQQSSSPAPVLAPPPQIQPPRPPQSSSVLRAQSNVVRIDVEVTDRSGKSIRGLKPDQFTITDDGKAQKVTAFSYSDIEKIETAGPEDSKPVVVPVNNEGPSAAEAVTDKVHDRRMIVLFFDMTSMETDDIIRAHDGAVKFLKQQMSPADLVAVVVFSTRLSVLANFTNDRATLNKAVAQVMPGAASQLANSLYAAAQNGEYDVQQDTRARPTRPTRPSSTYSTRTRS